MYSENSELPSRWIGTPDFVVTRQSDSSSFHFETYCTGPGQWGYNLWMVDDRRDQETSQTAWRSQEDVKKWLEDNIEAFEYDPDYGAGGWRIVDRDLSREANPYSFKI